MIRHAIFRYEVSSSKWEKNKMLTCEVNDNLPPSSHVH